MRKFRNKKNNNNLRCRLTIINIFTAYNPAFSTYGQQTIMFAIRTLFFLLLWSVIPGTIMVISCLYMCICSKFVFIGDDGHMRIFCCGKAVTGNLRLFTVFA